MCLSRRDAIRSGLYGAAGLLINHEIGGHLWAAAPRARATSVIQIWMWGGPSHLDTFDPKPAAGYDYCGPLNAPIATNVDGVVIGELLPMLARQADKYSIVRSLTHGINSHETASYAVQTGRAPGDRQVYPSTGAVMSFFKGYSAGYSGLIPPYIVLTEAQGRFSEAGFLGPRYAPFATGGDPAQPRFVVEGIVSQSVNDARQRDRRELLRQLNTLAGATPARASLEAFYRSEDQAYELMLGTGGKVFDLSQESDEMRDRYGRNTFGQSCLVARRLVEGGVPYVTINYKGWDTHRQNFQIMRQRLPQMDRGMATLLQDLADRGLLDRTVVWWGGEFGRTPRVQWRRRGMAAGVITARCSRRWWPAAGSKAGTSSAPLMRAENSCGIDRSLRAISSRASTSWSGSKPTPGCRILKDSTLACCRTDQPAGCGKSCRPARACRHRRRSCERTSFSPPPSPR